MFPIVSKKKLKLKSGVGGWKFFNLSRPLNMLNLAASIFLMASIFNLQKIDIQFLLQDT